MALETFVVHKEWIDSIASLPIEMQDKIIAEFVRYGVGLDPAHSEDAIAQSFVNILKNRIDFSKDQYAKKVEMSQTAGRKKKIDNQQIYNLAKEGKSSTEIATILNVSKSSVDHSDGWKNRKQDTFVF